MEMNDTSTGSVENITSGKATQLDDYRIVAPIAGIVIASDVEVGELVVSGISSYMVGTTIFQIGDPSELIVKSSISEIDLSRLKIGQDVRIVPDSYPDEVFQGKVKNIAPVGMIKQGSSIVTFEVGIEILDPDVRLRQGMSCDIDIISDTRENVLVLPVEAVHEVMAKDAEGEETSAVDYLVAYKWSEDEYKEVRVEIGLESTNRVEILSGLALDDEISLEASTKYKEFRDKEEEAKEEDQETKTKE
jgi:HlyD family secretion protein